MNMPQTLTNRIVIKRRSKLPVSLRTHRDEANYLRAKKQGVARKPLNQETPLRTWNDWILIDNEFPYSAVFSIHHMLIPKRKKSSKELSDKERAELENILDELSEQYDCFLVNFKNKQSITDHFHMHLLIYKEHRKQLKL